MQELLIDLGFALVRAVGTALLHLLFVIAVALSPDLSLRFVFAGRTFGFNFLVAVALSLRFGFDFGLLARNRIDRFRLDLVLVFILGGQVHGQRRA